MEQAGRHVNRSRICGLQLVRSELEYAELDSELLDNKCKLRMEDHSTAEGIYTGTGLMSVQLPGKCTSDLVYLEEFP